MQYLSHHIGVQRLISLNSMRIIIAIFEDVPFLGLNMFLLMTQPDLASNLVFMVSKYRLSKLAPTKPDTPYRW